MAIEETGFGSQVTIKQVTSQRWQATSLGLGTWDLGHSSGCRGVAKFFRRLYSGKKGL